MRITLAPPDALRDDGDARTRLAVSQMPPVSELHFFPAELALQQLELFAGDLHPPLSAAVGHHPAGARHSFGKLLALQIDKLTTAQQLRSATSGTAVLATTARSETFVWFGAELSTIFHSLSLSARLSFVPFALQLAPAVETDLKFIEELGQMLRTRSPDTGEVATLEQ